MRNSSAPGSPSAAAWLRGSHIQPPHLVGPHAIEAIDPERSRAPVQARSPVGHDNPAEPAHHDSLAGPDHTPAARRDQQACRNPGECNSNPPAHGLVPRVRGLGDATVLASLEPSGPGSWPGPRLRSLSKGLDDESTTVVLEYSRIDPYDSSVRSSS